jgi:hypothetical protein
MSGKAMAYFLGELNIFEKCTVTLVGYSSGSIVAYNCLRDLYMMRKSEQIYNFVSIGGLLSREKLDSEVIKLFPGTFYNFFSINDPVLLYSSKIDRKLRHPVGLRSVKFDSFVEKHLRVKVRNLDLSDEVHHHSEYLTRQNIIRISKFIENQELYNYMHDRLEKTENKISPSAYEIIIN